MKKLGHNIWDIHTHLLKNGVEKIQKIHNISLWYLKQKYQQNILMECIVGYPTKVV
jgi:hypothetical protein